MAAAVWVLMTAVLLMMMCYVSRAAGDRALIRTTMIMLLTMRAKHTCRSRHDLSDWFEFCLSDVTDLCMKCQRRTSQANPST